MFGSAKVRTKEHVVVLRNGRKVYDSKFTNIFVRLFRRWLCR